MKNEQTPKRKRKARKGTFRRLMRYVLRQRLQVTVILLTLAISTGLDVYGPKLVGDITDSIKLSQEIGLDLHRFLQALCLLAAVYVGSGLSLLIARRCLVYVAETIANGLREEMQVKLERLPLNYLDRHSKGDLLARGTSDMVMLTNVLQTNLSSMFTKLITILGILAVMFWMNWRMSLILLVMMPIIVITMRIITGITRKQFKKQQEAVGKMNGHAESMIRGSDILRSCNHEQAAMEEMEEINQTFFQTYLRSRTVSGIITPVTTLLNNLVYIALCVYGGMAIIRGSLSLGQLQAFLLYAHNLSAPINQFSMLMNQVQAGLAAADRIFEVLDAEEESEKSDVHETLTEAENVRGEVRFDHVRFGYEPERELMHDVNFRAEPGQVIAIVGPSGAGKTTLVNLLMRFYDIDGGQITLDGKDTAGLTRETLRSHVGMVLQDSWIFSGTIYENIAYGKPGASREEVTNAARKARCDQFINKLPEGYDTWISEESGSLSVGERQLLSIARVIIADPDILILDEATSNIDTRTEVLITRAMWEMMEGRTTFIIAHRLYTIKIADVILYMQDGDIKEVGNHVELMEKGGYYAELYNSSYA